MRAGAAPTWVMPCGVDVFSGGVVLGGSMMDDVLAANECMGWSWLNVGTFDDHD